MKAGHRFRGGMDFECEDGVKFEIRLEAGTDGFHEPDCPWCPMTVALSLRLSLSVRSNSSVT